MAHLRGIELVAVRSRNEINALTDDGSDVGISCGIGIIFKQQQIERHSHGIWNIHYGKLPQYRGRHPIAFAFLNNDWEIGVTIHRIDEAIDRGEKLAEGSVPRDLHDAEADIQSKIEQVLDSSLFAEAMRNYETGNLTTIDEGEYHASMAERFRDVNPSDLDSRLLVNLVKSQRTYGGVESNGNRFMDCRVVDVNKSYDGWSVVTCADGVAVALKDDREDNS